MLIYFVNLRETKMPKTKLFTLEKEYSNDDQSEIHFPPEPAENSHKEIEKIIFLLRTITFRHVIVYVTQKCT